MRRALTLLELILVLVILGALSAAALYSYRPHYLSQDINFVQMQLLQAKYQGIQYDKRHPTSDTNRSIGCVDLQEAVWKRLAKKLHYALHSTITSSYTTLCFDSFGRPHLDDNLTANTPIASAVQVLHLSYRSKEANLTILPQTGYVIIDLK